MIYLNRTCFNGLHRTNRRGEFNTPYGHYKNPEIVNREPVKAIGRYLRSADVTLLAADFRDVLSDVWEGFVFLDPPYDTDRGNFTRYAGAGFDRSDQIRLRDCCLALDRRGVRFMLANADTEFIRGLYRGFRIDTVFARRSVGASGASRGRVGELVVRNYVR